MVIGRRRDTWGVASSFMAVLANCHRDPKRKAFEAADFDPFAKPKPRGVPIRHMSIRDLAASIGAKGVK